MPISNSDNLRYLTDFAAAPPPTWLALVVDAGGSLTAVAYGTSGPPDVTICATGAGLPLLATWLYDLRSQGTVQALLVEAEAWLNGVGPAHGLSLLLLVSLMDNWHLRAPDAAAPFLPVVQESYPTWAPAAQRALAHILAWQGRA